MICVANSCHEAQSGGALTRKCDIAARVFICLSSALCIGWPALILIVVGVTSHCVGVSGDHSSRPKETPDPIPGYLPALSLKVIRTLMFCSRFYPGRDPCNLSHMISSHIIMGTTCDEAQYALIERDPANRYQGGHCQDKCRHFVIKSNCSK